MPTGLLASAVVLLLLSTCFLLDVNTVDAQTRQSRATRAKSARTSNQQIAQIVREFKREILNGCRRGTRSAGFNLLSRTRKAKHNDVEAMFTNDIIGSSLGGNGVHDPVTVRVFS